MLFSKTKRVHFSLHNAIYHNNHLSALPFGKKLFKLAKPHDSKPYNECDILMYYFICPDRI